MRASVGLPYPRVLTVSAVRVSLRSKIDDRQIIGTECVRFEDDASSENRGHLTRVAADFATGGR